MDINESPLYVLLNPSINPAQKDLPVTIYESGMYLLLRCHVIHLKADEIRRHSMEQNCYINDIHFKPATAGTQFNFEM